MKNLLFVLFILFNLNVVNADLLDDIKKKNKIVVGVDISLPPYGFVNKNGKQDGYDIEVSKLIAKELGVNLEIIPVTIPNRIPFLLSKKADIVLASFSITEERKKVIDFSNPYGVGDISVSGPENENINTFDDLKGKQIAITRASTQDIVITEASKKFKFNVVRYEDDALTHTSILAGRQKYLAVDYGIYLALKQNNPNLDLEHKFVAKEELTGIGFRKDNPEFKNRLNKIISDNMKNGFLPEKYKKYFLKDLSETAINFIE